MRRDILISEVGPRDGLQSIKTIMPLAAKKAWITALAASGLREIEVGSFVPAQVLPQLADTADVVAHALTIPNLTVAVLVPNLRGAEAAIRSRRPQAHHPFLRLGNSQSQERAALACTDVRRGSQHRRAAAFAARR